MKFKLPNYIDPDEWPGATRDWYVAREVHFCSRVPSHWTEKVKKQWREKGRNHRVENGNIVADFDKQAWFIEIDSLEQLLALIKDKEAIAIGPHTEGGAHWYIDDDPYGG